MAKKIKIDITDENEDWLQAARKKMDKKKPKEPKKALDEEMVARVLERVKPSQ